MTITSEIRRISYAGDGSTLSFAIPFRFLDNAHISAFLVEDATSIITPWVITTNYTLAGAGADAGGTLTAVVAPALNFTLYIIQDPPLTQAFDPEPGGSLVGLEAQLDLMVVQQQRTRDLALRGSEMTYAKATSDTTITGGVEDDITDLTALALPTQTDVDERIYWVEIHVQVEGLSAGDTVVISFYNGATGDKGDTLVDTVELTLSTSEKKMITHSFPFTPGADTRLNFGLSAKATSANFTVKGAATRSSTVRVTDITPI